MQLQTAVDLVGRAPWLDGIAEAAQGPVNRAVEKAGLRVRDALDGTWLGGPLHPALTDVPIGSWTASLLLDTVSPLAGGRLDRSADATLALGAAGAVAAAITGTRDASYLIGEKRRLATAHALLNVTALGLNLASLTLRLRGRRGGGRALSLAGTGIGAFSAHVGGHLSFGLGLRTNHVEGVSAPEEWADVAAELDLDDAPLLAAELDGEPVVLARVRGEIHAIAGRCSHMGGPLGEGERRGDCVACPWHDSYFDLATGEVVHGPATYRQPAYQVRVRGGRIELRSA